MKNKKIQEYKQYITITWKQLFLLAGVFWKVFVYMNMENKILNCKINALSYCNSNKKCISERLHSCDLIK